MNLREENKVLLNLRHLKIAVKETLNDMCFKKRSTPLMHHLEKTMDKL